MNAKLLGTLIVVIAVACIQNSILAQDAATSRGVVASEAQPLIVAPAPAYSDVYSPRFSSTNAEGLGRGLGAFARGVGEMNYYDSIAAANFTEAQRRAIQNQRNAVENYFELQRINREYREAELQHRRGNIVHANPVSASDQPMNVLNPITGGVEWPKPLLGREYAGYRKQLEAQFARTGATADPSASERKQVQQVTGRMKERLRNHIQDMKPSDYLAAKKFIDALASKYDSHASRDTQQLTAR